MLINYIPLRGERGFRKRPCGQFTEKPRTGRSYHINIDSYIFAGSGETDRRPGDQPYPTMLAGGPTFYTGL